MYACACTCVCVFVCLQKKVSPSTGPPDPTQAFDLATGLARSVCAFNARESVTAPSDVLDFKERDSLQKHGIST